MNTTSQVETNGYMDMAGKSKFVSVTTYRRPIARNDIICPFFRVALFFDINTSDSCTRRLFFHCSVSLQYASKTTSYLLQQATSRIGGRRKVSCIGISCAQCAAEPKNIFPGLWWVSCHQNHRQSSYLGRWIHLPQGRVKDGRSFHRNRLDESESPPDLGLVRLNIDILLSRLTKK